MKRVGVRKAILIAILAILVGFLCYDYLTTFPYGRYYVDMASRIVKPRFLRCGRYFCWHHGGTPAPMAPHKSIRLESEDVTIRLKGRSSYTIHAVYRFFNSSDTVTERIAFPVPEKWPVAFGRFEVWVDGRKMRLIRSADPRWTPLAYGKPCDREERDRWLTLSVRFPTGKTKTIRAIYEESFCFGRTASERYFRGSIRYRSGGGSYWKGPICRVTYTVDCIDVGGFKLIEAVSVPGVSRMFVSQTAVKYTMRNYEPKLRDEFQVHIRE